MHNSIISLIEVLGTFAFAVSGATMAIDKKFDPIGLFALAFITAIGGGTLRDVMIGSTPIAWLADYRSIVVIIAAALLSMLFINRIKRLHTLLTFFDAAGLALFTIVGINKGMALGLPAFSQLALGVITGTFGGLLRDVISNETPMLFTKEIYAVAAIVGGTLYIILLRYWLLPLHVAEGGSILVIVLVRMLAVRYRWVLKPLGR